MRRLVLLLLALGLAGCGGDAAPPTERLPVTEPPAGPLPTATDGEEEADGLAQSCTNERGGFTVDYPEGWHTNEPDGVPPCTFFHPEPFELPEATEALDVAVRIARESVPLDEIAGESPAQEVTAREETAVDGRPAVRIEYVSTGEALLPEGTRGTTYLVNLERETIVATTFEGPGLDYRRNVEVLDDMVATLTLE